MLARWMPCTIAALVLAAVSAASGGEVREDLRAPSPALGRALPYSIYLPDGYAAGEARYPVAYLLHGFGGGQREWIDGAQLETMLDRLIAAGEIAPLIAVMPEAGKSWYVDSARHGGPGDYATAIARDLVAAVDRRYRTRASAGQRAVAGNSMGGFGALRFAFLHPDTFAAVAALSPAIFEPGRPSEGLTPVGRWYPGTFGTPFDPDLYAAATPFAHVEQIAAAPNPPRILLAVGDDDYFDLQDGTAAMFLELRRHGLDPEFRVGDGDHSWRFWRPMAEQAFRFFDAGWTASPAR